MRGYCIANNILKRSWSVNEQSNFFEANFDELNMFFINNQLDTQNNNYLELSFREDGFVYHRVDAVE